MQDVDQVVNEDGDSIKLQGSIENAVGSALDDTFYVSFAGFPRSIDGGGYVNGDVLHFDDRGLAAIDDGASLIVDGYEPVNYADFEMIEIIHRVLDHIEVTPEEVALKVGEQQRFSAVGFDADSAEVIIRPIWSTTGGTISADGLYTATVAGNFTVTVSIEGSPVTESVFTGSGLAIQY